MVFFIVLFILSVICFIIGIVSFYKANEIKVVKNNEEKEYNNYIKSLQESITILQQKEVALLKEIDKEKQNMNNTYSLEKDRLDKELGIYKENSNNAINNYNKTLEQSYQQIEINYDTKVNQLELEYKDIEEKLQQLKTSLAAAITASLNEQKVNEQEEFYTLKIEQKNIYEINLIKSIESQLLDPRPLRMLIWTSYYSKKANELCSRVLGKNKITGIYKITNIKNKTSYIGQAKDIKERFREHMKCGLGIDTPTNNKLYMAMLKDGIESFSFELLEECEPALLNEKEKFYIDLFSTYDYGYNSNKGISK